MKNNKNIIYILPIEKSCVSISKHDLLTKVPGITEADLAKGEKRLEIETRGPWGLVSKVSGVAMAGIWSGNSDLPTGTRHCIGYALIMDGTRVLNHCAQGGYEMEGKVSIGGKYYRAFTSSQLFQYFEPVENKHKLLNLAYLHVCGLSILG